MRKILELFWFLCSRVPKRSNVVAALAGERGLLRFAPSASAQAAAIVRLAGSEGARGATVGLDDLLFE
jgi:hypothetical protein